MASETLTPNEVYRGYTIVTMVEPTGEIRICDGDGDYLLSGENIATFFSYDHAKCFIDGLIRNGGVDLGIPRQRVELGESGMNFIVNTPGGEIRALSVGDKNYPSLDIMVGGRIVAFVEWHPDSEQFNLHVYSKDNEDEPVFTLEDITN